MNVPAETAHTAWMAGHMMGDHWPTRTEAVRVLTKVPSHGRYEAGRRAAAMALKDLMAEGVGAGMRRKIQASLERIKR